MCELYRTRNSFLAPALPIPIKTPPVPNFVSGDTRLTLGESTAAEQRGQVLGRTRLQEQGDTLTLGTAEQEMADCCRVFIHRIPLSPSGLQDLICAVIHVGHCESLPAWSQLRVIGSVFGLRGPSAIMAESLS